ncbi:D-aminoacyl-tRNA deacylase [Chitinivibrio alkaliphilus]|uniref:D-aminoacyl-tRNA deacylase n=1 Tax=Chitinivibrio alkaliphilus ACht1 TaxID=1313304 RepID=U7DC63_9BACT|nr:D-aminoacyl-tRNA deacylase [Chitinivibrio alkaliphilus]ERP39168.1 D-tyrosyl-tRNA(Tyr) deacylase [Chitinivibrio alkaliphilus ACht1]
MRAVIQRVSRAHVSVEGTCCGKIGQGILVYLAVHAHDTDEIRDWITTKIRSLRIFEDESGKMNRSLEEIGGAVLVISQFTLYGDCRKGRRPSFSNAAPPHHAKKQYEAVIADLKQTLPVVESGTFQAHMHVVSENDGPVTLILEKEGDQAPE